MLIPKPLRQFLEVLRGRVTPPFIVLSVTLGFWFGLTPGWYGLHVALLVIVLVLRVHLGTFILFAGVGRALCLAAAPVLYYAGRWGQENMGGLFDGLSSVPLIGITDFNRCAVAGATLLGPLVGVLAGLLLARTVRVFRRTWRKLEEHSDRFSAWQQKRWVRWLDWFLLGKRAADARAALEEKGGVVRLAGVAVAAVVVLVSAVGLHLMKGDRLRGLVARQLTAANGAEVTLEGFDLSALSGRVQATGVQVTDPAAPQRNRIRIDGMTADAGLWSLACGRLVVDDVTLTGLAFDEPRESPGVVLDGRAPADRKPSDAFDPGRFGLKFPDVERLVEFFRKADEVKKKLEEAAEWLPQSEPPPAAAAPPQTYLGYLNARGAVSPTPRIVVRQAVLDDVTFETSEVGRSTITCTNLSDAPRAAGLPVVVRIKSKERDTDLTITSHYDRPEGGAAVAGTIGDVDLKELQAELNPQNLVRFESGLAKAEVSGTATRETIDLRLAVETKDMRASTAGRGFFGLDPRAADEALKVMSNLKTTLRLVGPPDDPRLVFDVDGLKDEFKTGLVSAGKQELVSRLDVAIGDQMPEGTPTVDEVVDDPLKAGKRAIDGLFGGKDKKDRKKAE